MAIHCYGEEVKDVNIRNSKSERIPVDVSINNQLAPFKGEDELVLSVALRLYANSNFDSIKNLHKHAGLCLDRANAFAEVYTKFKSKEAITDPSRVTDVKLYVQYNPGDWYVYITIVDVSERFMYELSKAEAFLLGFESYNKFGHKSGRRNKYKVLHTDWIPNQLPDLDSGLGYIEQRDSYIIFTATSFYKDVLNKTFRIEIPDVWDTRAFSRIRDSIINKGKSWNYKPIQIRPTFRSYRTGWQRANLNIINYKWLTFQYPDNN